MVTFTINISPMLVYIPYMDPMGMMLLSVVDPCSSFQQHVQKLSLLWAAIRAAMGCCRFLMLGFSSIPEIPAMVWLAQSPRQLRDVSCRDVWSKGCLRFDPEMTFRNIKNSSSTLVHSPLIFVAIIGNID